ncbi:Protein kinase-like domain [Pseudocohnilembus persalinus]|uniref:Cyclin-dependent kinase 2 homolog n=1 Tax=Pseudocohnilembus persalinus TaxID=266149 RepID=A0A0V0QWX8_PSEPJ|nr:Protein kinase-like domain [Pseudocohnilembus persalinus]|eukprot:KRX06440.1 Protein kinase-like domain [Pseudocohnilembus persalinus]
MSQENSKNQDEISSTNPENNNSNYQQQMQNNEEMKEDFELQQQILQNIMQEASENLEENELNSSEKQENEDLNFVHHEKNKSDEDLESRPSLMDIYEQKKIKYTVIKKYLQGVAILDIHQISSQHSLDYILNEENIKYEILRSMRSLQRQCIKTYTNPQIREQLLQLIEGQIIGKKATYRDLKNYENLQQFKQETMEFLNLDDIMNISHFGQFKINKNHWPYLVSYEILLKVPIELGQTQQQKQYKVFCDFQSKIHKNYEIFDAFFPSQVNMIVNFWTDELRDYSQELLQKTMKSAKQILSNQKKINNTLEIKQEYFDIFYKRLLTIGSGGFAEVELYYDTVEDRLLAVKQPVDAQDKYQKKQGYEKQPIRLLETEKQRIIKAIRDFKFEDKQMKQLYMQQRNILREIKRLWQLNSCLKTDPRAQYVNKMEGVVIYDLKKQYKASTYQQQASNSSSQSSKDGYQSTNQTVKLVFLYYGGCEFNNKSLTCDLHLYFLRNKSYFEKIEQIKKNQIIKSIYFQIFKAMEFLHDEQVMLRDLKDDNILVRRKYDLSQPEGSFYEILFIDFGMSKKNKLKIPIFDVEISRRISIPYDQNGIVFRHPRFLYGADKFEKKDDIFALGIMLLRLYDNIEFPITNIDESIRQFIQYICGIPYNILYGYYKKTSKPISEKKCSDYYDKIPKNIKEIQNSDHYKKFFRDFNL